MLAMSIDEDFVHHSSQEKNAEDHHTQDHYFHYFIILDISSNNIIESDETEIVLDHKKIMLHKHQQKHPQDFVLSIEHEDHVHEEMSGAGDMITYQSSQHYQSIMKSSRPKVF